MASTVSSTTLSFGLVSCPVSLKKVADKKDVGFKLCTPDGEAVKQMYRAEESGELFEPAALEKGVEADGKITVVGKETIKNIDASVAIDGLNIERFIPLADVPFERAEGAYYIAPTKAAGLAEKKPLALLRDGLKAHARAGVGKLTLRSKQRAFVVFEKDGGLLVNTLVFADAFEQAAEAGEVLADVPEADGKTLALFETLIASMEGEASDLDSYTDDSFEAKAELVAKAVAGEKIEVVAVAAAPEPTDNIEELLLASVAAAQPAKPAKAKAAKAKVAA
jgi:Ku protein